MKFNLPKKVRLALYVFTSAGSPIIMYLQAKEFIGVLEVSLWAAEVTVVSALAAFNTTGPEEDPEVEEDDYEGKHQGDLS